MTRVARWLVLATVLVALVRSSTPAVAPTASVRGAPSGTTEAVTPTWRLVWSDEFGGTAGTPPDPRRWTFDLGGEPQWGNAEWEYYTNRPSNAALDGEGHLAISARRERLPGMTPCAYGPCDITSARMTTLGAFAQAYGRFEARVKVPAGAGLWPTFWMMGDDIDVHRWPTNGEIDVMEINGGNPGTVYGSVHGPGFSRSGLGGQYTLPAGTFADGFHVFAVDWAPGRIDWLLDGVPYASVSRSQLGPGRRWPFDHPFYLLLDLAVGGAWPGPPDASTPFPASLLVDDVRVFAHT